MRRRPITWRLLLTFACLAFVPLALWAEEEMTDEGKKEIVPGLEETISTSRHTMTLDGEEIPYTATAGTYLLKSDKGATLASIFYTSYTREGVEDPASRPVTFSFNGGPGAASVWVHMGAFGPKKVLADEEGMPRPPPGRLVDNPYSLLDVTDLVFIDPVSTGYSRKALGIDRKMFHGLEGDIESVGTFIHLWITRNARWASPKLIAGESYGTTRAAGLAGHLQNRYGMYLNGIVLISPVLNWQNQEFHIGNDMAYIIHLPTYAATARFHGKLAPELSGDLEAFLAEVEAFALGDYAHALLQGDRLPAAEQSAVAAKVARYTGLSQEFVERSNLRIELFRFMKELRRDERLVVGRLDSRFTFVDMDAAGESPEFDPSLTGVDIGYVTLLNDYLRRELGYETDLVYESLNPEVWPWDYTSHANRYVNVAEILRGAMVRNPSLRVLFTCGYYDFATPYFDSEHTIAHLGLPPAQRQKVEITYYESGHMMYIREVDHAKFKDDVATFIRQATAE